MIGAWRRTSVASRIDAPTTAVLLRLIAEIPKGYPLRACVSTTANRPEGGFPFRHVYSNFGGCCIDVEI